VRLEAIPAGASLEVAMANTTYATARSADGVARFPRVGLGLAFGASLVPSRESGRRATQASIVGPTEPGELVRARLAYEGDAAVLAGRLVDELLLEDRFDNLLAIGVDEISYRRHHRYLTIVMDHDQERVIWAGEGKSADTLQQFFDELTDEQLESIQFVSIDMAQAYISAVEGNLPDATIVFDRFHVARLAQDRVDEVRRALMRALDPDERRHLKRTRWVLLKRPGRLRRSERARLETIRKANDKLYRAYLLKETLLDVYDQDDSQRARDAIDAWLSWAQRSRLNPFVRLARTVRKHLDGILAFIDSRLTNARLEGMNNKIRLLSHRAYGFHSADSLIAMVYLCCAKITLPEVQLA